MNFSEAIQALQDGKYIVRASWSENDGYLVLMPRMKHVWKMTTTPSVNAGNNLFSMEDYNATDWQLLGDDNGESETEVTTESGEAISGLSANAA